MCSIRVLVRNEGKEAMGGIVQAHPSLSEGGSDNFSREREVQSVPRLQQCGREIREKEERAEKEGRREG